jgi:hypothetical protein
MSRSDATTTRRAVKIPNLEQLIIERDKVSDYLLNPAHRYGASKARFFGEFGFQPENWTMLADALREHARTREVVHVTETGFGPRFIVEGELIAPDGRTTRIRTVWQFDRSEIAPRLITAYPTRQT